ncbi:MAG: hypothetical protein KatS3mg002_0788 [Candidatus Woesearchaeota archaeon]|nr:MAG: hypothetical protein KatS3mg002_0788 [Candidatus Woesearchaeota archaeon]
MAEKLTIEEFGKKLGWKEEEFEDNNEVYVKTNYPEPFRKYRLVYESFGLSMEETYFWILDQLRYQFSFPNIEKITDVFSSSENSSFFGQASQRLGIQQDKIQTILATVGKMVKDLFSLVRELRIIDERLEAYNAWDKNKSKSADVTLKEIFINFVENQGGQMKTSSVYGLAQNLGYATLPDWFFNTNIFNKADIDSTVDKLPTNVNLKNVLRRKLFEFMVWKEKTHKELINRRKFNLHYLRQHWGVIKMYMGWLKPYLRNVKRLTMNEQQIMSPEIISAFETAALEIELLAYDSTKIKKDSYSPCILVTFKYFVKPSLSYQQPESYQRGPIHVGKVDITFRSYGWSDKDIDTYKKYREKEELELLSIIDSSLKAAMDALSEDLEKYLAEAGEEEFKKKEKEEEKKDDRTAIQKWLNIRPVEEHQKVDILEPFKGVFMGFGEIIGAFLPSQKTKAKIDVSPKKSKSAGAAASKSMWLLLKNYKKAHQMLTW